MSHPLRAFISYRRADSFIHMPAGADLDFFTKLKAALVAEGFTEVFHDLDPTVGILPGQNFASRIYDEIEKCDLFVVLVGRNWADILKQKEDAGEQDFVVYEISAALKQE